MDTKSGDILCTQSYCGQKCAQKCAHKVIADKSVHKQKNDDWQVNSQTGWWTFIYYYIDKRYCCTYSVCTC